MKQTAVEWLEEKLIQDNIFSTEDWELFQQAKEMEKEQQGYSKEDMKRAFCNGGQLDHSTLTSTEFGTKLLNKWFEQFKKK
jgi:hypothetical protein